MAPASSAALAASTVSSGPTFRGLFHITATADPGLLPRLIEPVARLGHTPSRVHASREAGDGSELVVDLRITGLARAQADRMAGCLRAVVGVRLVIAVVEPE